MNQPRAEEVTELHKASLTAPSIAGVSRNVFALGIGVLVLMQTGQRATDDR